MSDDRSQEDIWKDDAEQLKEDLSQRETVIEKREVPIQFGESPPSQQSTKETGGDQEKMRDDMKRKSLGLD